MGYYSTVYLGIEPSLVEELLTFVGANKEVFNLLFKDATETVKTRTAVCCSSGATSSGTTPRSPRLNNLKIGLWRMSEMRLSSSSGWEKSMAMYH